MGTLLEAAIALVMSFHPNDTRTAEQICKELTKESPVYYEVAEACEYIQFPYLEEQF